MSNFDQLHVGEWTYDAGRGTYRTLDVKAGRRGIERVVPPAGEAYAFDRLLWARHVQVTVSPSGRSVRVYVDGQEVKP